MKCPDCRNEMKSGWLRCWRGTILFSEKKKGLLWKFWPLVEQDDINLSDCRFSWYCPGCEKIVIDIKGKNKRHLNHALTVPDVSQRTIYVGAWSYHMPVFSRDSDGCIVLIDRFSPDSPEAFEWGIDADNEPFERHYQGDKDMWFEESADTRAVTMKELTAEIERLIELFWQNGYPDWAGAYQNILSWLDSGFPQSEEDSAIS